VKLDKYQRILYFIVFFALSLIDLLLILSMLEWNPALSLLEWAKNGGFTFSIIFLVILFVLSFSFSFTFIFQTEITTITLENSAGLGEVKISINGIKNSVRDIAHYFSEIQEIRPDVENVRGKLELTLKIKVPTGVDITRIVNELQQRVKVYFQNVLSINLESVNVIIEDVISVKRENK